MVKFVIGSGSIRMVIPLATGEALHEQRRAVKRNLGLLK